MGATGFTSFVMDAIEWDRDGPGPQEPVLCLAGLFVASPAIDGIATWNGATYGGIGTGINGGPGQCYTVTAYPNGHLVPAGSYTSANGLANTDSIALWNGSSWSALGPGMVNGSEVFASAVLPDGRLVAGGNFTNLGGSMSQSLAVWDGLAWSPLGGLNNGPGPAPRVDVYDLLVLRNGDLIIAGFFVFSGTTFTNHVMRYDGTTLTPIPLLDDPGDWVVKGVKDLAEAPPGTGREFVAAVSYTVDNSPFITASVMSFDGSGWSGVGTPFGGQFNSAVNAVTVLPNGDIIAGGSFSSPQNRIAIWRGAGWEAMGSGVNSSPQCLLTRRNGEVVVGGSFTQVDGQLSRYWARWGGCPVCDATDFNGDGVFPDNQDIVDFIDVFAGGTCATGTCGDLDFNNDGIFPDNADAGSLLSVFAGGPC